MKFGRKLRRAIRRARRKVGRTLKRASRTVRRVARNPLVRGISKVARNPWVQRAVLGAIPGAGPGAVAALEAARAANKLRKRVMRSAHTVRRVRRLLGDTGGLEEGGTIYVVETNDNPWKIAERLTGDGNRWRELVKANPQKKVDSKTGNFAGLWTGNRLNVPESWQTEVDTGPKLPSPPISKLPAPVSDVLNRLPEIPSLSGGEVVMNDGPAPSGSTIEPPVELPKPPEVPAKLPGIPVSLPGMIPDATPDEVVPVVFNDGTTLPSIQQVPDMVITGDLPESESPPFVPASVTTETESGNGGLGLAGVGAALFAAGVASGVIRL